MREALDFDAINQAALTAFPAVLNRLLPRGKAMGRELVAFNPNRFDRNLGSFKINRHNGKWCEYVAPRVMLRICDWVLSHGRLTASTQHNLSVLREVA
jgi:hypothetical protein